MTNAPRLLFCYSGGYPSTIDAQIHFRVLKDEYFPADAEVIEIDVMTDPEAAELHNVIATPMLINLAAGRPVRIIGDLSDYRRVMGSLNLPMPKPR